MNNFQTFSMMFKDKVDILALMSYKEKIEKLSDDKIAQIYLIDLKSPVIGLLLGLAPAWLLCGLSFDRFYKGDIGLGIAKIVLWFFSFVCIFVAAIVFNSRIDLDYEGNIIFVIIAMLLGFVILFIWNLIDFFLVWQGIKKDNLMKIIQFLEQNDENLIGNKQ